MSRSAWCPSPPPPVSMFRRRRTAPACRRRSTRSGPAARPPSTTAWRWPPLGWRGYDDRSLLLLSDGGDTRSTKATKASATAALKRNGVRAEVIGFKTDDSDNTVLKGFAAAGGGSVAAAGNDEAVRQAFEAAAKALDSQVTFTFTPDASLRSEQVVTVTGKANGQSFQAQTTVDFGAAPVSGDSRPQPVCHAVAGRRGTEHRRLRPRRAQTGFHLQLLLALVASRRGGPGNRRGLGGAACSRPAGSDESRASSATSPPARPSWPRRRSRSSRRPFRPA